MGGKTLNDRLIKTATATEKKYKLYDRDGLFLLVHPNGSKYWYLKWYYDGKARELSLGKYPAIGLADARKQVMEIRTNLLKGILPTTDEFAPIKTFQQVAEEWVERQRKSVTENTFNTISRRFELHVYPIIGDIPYEKIKRSDMLNLAQDIESRGINFTAKRCINQCERVFEWLLLQDKIPFNPAASVGKTIESIPVRHNPHLEQGSLPDFMKKLYSYNGNPITRCAAIFLLRNFTRTIEMRRALVEHIDMQEAIWRIPDKHMKMRRPHIVPLSKQSIALLEEVASCRDEGAVHVFAGTGKHGMLSENAVLYVIKKIGYKGLVTGHGFRGTASTALNEHQMNADAIELQLAHKIKSVRAAYNHAQHLDERRKILQYWSDLLDELASTPQ